MNWPDTSLNTMLERCRFFAYHQFVGLNQYFSGTRSIRTCFSVLNTNTGYFTRTLHISKMPTCDQPIIIFFNGGIGRVYDNMHTNTLQHMFINY